MKELMVLMVVVAMVEVAVLTVVVALMVVGALKEEAEAMDLTEDSNNPACL